MNTPSTPDTLPIERQTRWFVEQVHSHDAALKQYLRSSFPSVGDVEDVVQESYLRVWHRQMQQPLASARSFLYRVARNLAVDRLRRTAISPIEPSAEFISSRAADNNPDAAEAASGKEEVQLLLDAIESLPPRCREILVLQKLHGLSLREIAHRLGIAEGTVQIQGAKGMRRCAEYLRERGIGRKESA
ncbi:MAG: RNA polymerase sigma factor [Opitutaceae bacterium]|nr:RNA polymerase sigma factor [Opitutaceae bacterium]